MHATHSIDLSRSQASGTPGLGRRILNWLDFVAATLEMANAWTNRRRVSPRTLARAGMTSEIQERVMGLRY